MTEFLFIVFLAVIQGLGEFLPISSSGHTLVFGHLLQGDKAWMCDPMTLSIVLHAGTLLSLLLWFRREIMAAFRDKHLLFLIFVTSIPTAVLGLAVKYALPELESSLDVAGTGFFLTAGLLFWVLRRYERNQATAPMTMTSFSWRRALGVGLAQGIAVLPGFSRSGWTITAATALGMDRRQSATFSFLIAIPVLGGVLLLELVDRVIRGGNALPTSDQAFLYLVGALVSFGVGLASLSILMKVLNSGRLYWWSGWLVLVGVLAFTLK